MKTPGELIAQHLQYANAARYLNNNELADTLMRALWARLPFDPAETAIIEETIERLRAMKKT